MWIIRLVIKFHANYLQFHLNYVVQFANLRINYFCDFSSESKAIDFLFDHFFRTHLTGGLIQSNDIENKEDKEGKEDKRKQRAEIPVSLSA